MTEDERKARDMQMDRIWILTMFVVVGTAFILWLILAIYERYV